MYNPATTKIKRPIQKRKTRKTSNFPRIMKTIARIIAHSKGGMSLSE